MKTPWFKQKATQAEVEAISDILKAIVHTLERAERVVACLEGRIAKLEGMKTQ